MPQCTSCGSSDFTQYGPYAGRIVAGGEVPDLKDQIIARKCSACEYLQLEKQLTSGVRVATAHIVKEGRAEDVQRIIVRFLSDEPDQNALIKEFYIWLTQVFVEDLLRLKESAEAHDFLQAAILVAGSEYRKAHQVPKYGGVDCREEFGGCRIVSRPETYNYPIKPDV
ncbi:MAG: hypothetical protein G01um101438_335 [Parcubacteria group bacterium Gr01-1014_38]|nr:MAG: hypothetical protein G01um101438_335 [Parcubacteria group bacterium Gr01-1014_38]